MLQQLSKLLLLVFNLPAVFELLSGLFSVSQKDGRLELGIVNTISETIVMKDVAALKESIESGKQTQEQELEQETEELIEQYSEIEDEESRAYFIQQARQRQQRRLEEIRSINPDDVVNDQLIDQLIQEKKKQLEPAIASSLTPITSFLGIPVMITKLQEYVPSATVPSLTSQDEASEEAERLQESEGAEGSVFNGFVGEGDLDVQFLGETNTQDFKLYSSLRSSSRVTLYATGGEQPIRARIVDYGVYTEDRLGRLFSLTVDRTVVDIRVSRLEDLGPDTEEIYGRYGGNEETEIIVRITDSEGKQSDVTIPALVDASSDAE